jgi:hypothetical protein
VLLWDVFQGILVQDLGTVILALPYLELREVDEELLVKGSFAQLGKRPFEVEATVSVVSLVLFEVGCFNIASCNRVDVDEPL